MNKLLPLYGLIITTLVNGITLCYLYFNNTTKLGKLNYRFISMHIAGALFLMIGVRQFAFLTEYNILQTLSEHGIHEVVQRVNPHQMLDLFQWLFIATIAGFIGAIIISTIVTFRKKIPLVNLLIVFTVALILLCVFCYRFEDLLDLRDSVGHLFRGDWLAFKYIIPGIAFTSVSLVLFFNLWPVNMFRQEQSQYSSTN